MMRSDVVVRYAGIVLIWLVCMMCAEAIVDEGVVPGFALRDRERSDERTLQEAPGARQARSKQIAEAELRARRLQHLSLEHIKAWVDGRLPESELARVPVVPIGQPTAARSVLSEAKSNPRLPRFAVMVGVTLILGGAYYAQRRKTRLRQ